MSNYPAAPKKKGSKSCAKLELAGKLPVCFCILRIGSLGATVLVPCEEWASFGTQLYKWSQIQGVTYAHLEGLYSYLSLHKIFRSVVRISSTSFF